MLSAFLISAFPQRAVTRSHRLSPVATGFRGYSLLFLVAPLPRCAIRVIRGVTLRFPEASLHDLVAGTFMNAKIKVAFIGAGSLASKSSTTALVCTRPVLCGLAYLL